MGIKLDDLPESARRVVSFSCGTASAVAAKLTLKAHPDAVIINAFIAEEHRDNRRFLADVERWIGKSVVVLRDEKYGASAHEVVRRERYTKGPFGAPCSRVLKRRLLNAVSLPGDIAVLGFTVGEQDRADNIRDVMNGKVEFPLIEAGLTKPDCMAIIQRAGIELPKLSRMGYTHDNCIGCWKAGMGHWNAVRKDFPDVFEKCATIMDGLPETAYLWADAARPGRRISLRQLDPNAGRRDEPTPDCGFACLMAEEGIM